jgi:hypothetical protein
MIYLHHRIFIIQDSGWVVPVNSVNSTKIRQVAYAAILPVARLIARPSARLYKAGLKIRDDVSEY